MNCTLSYNTYFLNMTNTKLSFNHMCDIFRNCYPTVTNGINSIDNTELSDYVLNDLVINTNDSLNNDDIYFSDVNSDSLISEKEFLLENVTVGTVDLLINTVVKVPVSEYETPVIKSHLSKSSNDLNAICDYYSINDINTNQLNISISDNEYYLSDISMDSSHYSPFVANISDVKQIEAHKAILSALSPVLVSFVANLSQDNSNQEYL